MARVAWRMSSWNYCMAGSDSRRICTQACRVYESGPMHEMTVARRFGSHVLVFGASVFMLGLLCALALADRREYRFGGATLAIVLLIPRAGPAWETAFHRFAEVSIGIGVALILTVVWPEREAAALVENVNDSTRKTDGDQGRLNELPRSPAALPPTTDERS